MNFACHPAWKHQWKGSNFDILTEKTNQTSFWWKTLLFTNLNSGHWSYLQPIIQSARLSFQPSELGPPPPRPQGSIASPLFCSKGGDTLACGEGGGGGPNQFRGKGQTLWYSRYTVIPLRNIPIDSKGDHFYTQLQSQASTGHRGYAILQKTNALKLNNNRKPAYFLTSCPGFAGSCRAVLPAVTLPVAKDSLQWNNLSNTYLRLLYTGPKLFWKCNG
jgi:hypothetical protein